MINNPAEQLIQQIDPEMDELNYKIISMTDGEPEDHYLSKPVKERKNRATRLKKDSIYLEED